jgi:hypothetical protein
MAQVEEIEKAVKSLPAKELRRFRRWFALFDAEAWDAQIEADSTSGKLDTLAHSAIEDHSSGNSKEL